jgi:hypothetical protein
MVHPGGLREGGRQQPQAAGTGQAVQKLSLELDGKYLENLWEMLSFMEIIYIHGKYGINMG